MRLEYLGWRVFYSFLAFAISITFTFILIHAMPGDYLHVILPSLADKNPLATELFEEQFGFDKPLVDQYVLYVINVFQGNWGYSIQYGQPVTAVIISKLCWTMIILLPATLLSILIGVAIGSYSGWSSGSLADSFIFKIMIFLGAVPSYWWAIILILVLGFYLGLFPLGGYMSVRALNEGLSYYDVLYHAVLPIVALTLAMVPGVYYLMRTSMLQTVGQDYILTARCKGLGELKILQHHALKNAMLPMVTMMAIELAHTIMGSVFVETIFSWPGMGYLTYEALRVRDIPLLQGIFLMDTLIIILANMATDFSYPFIDPRAEVGKIG
ncbi:MAG: dipeptide transporter permease DppB [Methanosaeta sp. PtaU1.Bin112]|nr:MAG: dipeptide transporter permease DppB [Methanosaeta sp. PtaU1.Bin112]